MDLWMYSSWSILSDKRDDVTFTFPHTTYLKGFIGVIMNICGSVGSSAGLLIQKKAAMMQDERIASGQAPWKRIGVGNESLSNGL